MSTSESSSSSVTRSGSGAGSPARNLVSEHGKTSIADGVVAKVADIAAREVRGVHDLAGGATGTFRRLTPGLDDRGTGAAVEVGEREAIVDLSLVVEYGVSIPDVSEAVRQNVIDRLQYITGLEVKEVNVEVTDLFFAEEERRKQAAKAERQRDEPSRVQ